MTPDIKRLLSQHVSAGHDAQTVLGALRSAALPPSTLDAVFRDLLFDLCESSERPVNDIQTLLSLALACTEADLCGPELSLSILEEAVDTQTIDGCNDLFTFLETHRASMTAKMGKGQILLRLCNDLLRRLSKTEDTVFCGRILIFLSLVFPLSERSAVNLRGEYNLDNITSFDEAAAGQDGLASDDSAKAYETTREFGDISVDGIYQTFWSLQKYFCNPSQIIAAPLIMAQFRTAVSEVSDALRKIEGAIPKYTSSETSAQRPVPSDPVTDARGYFTPKMLTSRKLLKLELADLTFRRHVLVQILITADYLLSLTAANKEKWNTGAALANKSMQSTYTLPVADSEWISDLRTEVSTTIEAGKDGSEFLQKIETVLRRDRSWLQWKCSGCPSYDRPEVDQGRPLQAPKRIAALTSTKKPYQHVVGNAVLSKLWTSAGSWSEAELNGGLQIPAPESFMQSIEAVTLELQDTVQEEERYRLEDSKASMAWRALRIARTTDVRFFTEEVAGGKLDKFLEANRDSVSSSPGVSTGGEPDLAKVNGILAAKRPAAEAISSSGDEKRQKLST